MNEEDRFMKQLDKLIVMVKGTNDTKLIHEFFEFMEILQKDYHRITEQGRVLSELEKKVDRTSLKIMKKHDMMFDDQIEMRYEIKRYIDSLDKKLRIVERTMFARPRTTGIFLILYGRKFLNIAKDYDKKSHGSKI